MFKKALKYIILPLIGLLAAVLIVTASLSLVNKQRVKTAFKINSPDGVETLEKVTLGGLGQWISIRGKSIKNPVLLFLHGGPGSPEMAFMRHINSGLEEHFVVVNWDQRGAGKSYISRIPAETMNIDQFVSDAYELTQYLRERFKAEKIYLAGHSWGTIVGSYAVRQYPELYHAYIGIGQAVNFREGEKISYRYLLDMARKTENTKALNELEQLGEPPYTGEDFIRKTNVHRKWLMKFGGVNYTSRDMISLLVKDLKILFAAPEYSLPELFKIMKGSAASATLLWDALLSIDFIEQVPKLEIPVYFIVGKHDYVTVAELVEKYYETLEAPYKELFWFEYSGHSPNYEEPEKFQDILVNKVLPQTYIN